MYKRILVTTDGSPLSDKAVKDAIELAAALQSELIALHVVRIYPTSYMDGDIALSRSQADEAQKQWVEHGHKLVDAVAVAAVARGLTARGIVLKSNAVADTVIETAHQHQCDLVVMASHGRKGAKRVLLGSETQHVLAATDIATLVLR